MVEEIIDQGHEGDTEDREVPIVLLLEVCKNGFVLDVDGPDFFAPAHDFFELVGLNFSLIHG